MYALFAVPEPILESKSFEENIIRNHGLPRRETPRKDGPNSLNFVQLTYKSVVYILLPHLHLLLLCC